MKPRKKIKQMVADQQTRSAGAQIPGGVGLLKQTTMAVTYLQNCSHPPPPSIIPQLMNGGWRAEMGVGGMVWGEGVEFELPVLPSHTIPHLPPKMCQGVTVGNQFFETALQYTQFLVKFCT